MSIAFENPSFLWASGLILIPILLHLFNLQIPQTVYFSSNKFLKKITTETRSASKLKRLLLLLTRILAILMAVFAFSKPFIPTQATATINTNDLLIIIDNSNSMSAQSAHGTCLEYAKQIAVSIVQNSNRNAQFWIADNNKVYASKKAVNQTKAIEAINSIQHYPKPEQITDILSKALWKTNGNIAEAIILTDCQKTTFDYRNIADSTVKIRILPILAQGQRNISIDSCWFRTDYHKPSDADSISISLNNFTDDDQEIPIRLFINDSLKNIATITLPSGKSEHLIHYQNPKSGNVELKVSIEDFPVTFDNNYYYAYTLSNTIHIIELGADKPNHATKSMYFNRQNFAYHFQPMKTFSPSELERHSLSIVSNLDNLSESTVLILKKYVDQDGSLLVFQGNKISQKNSFSTLKNLGIHIDSVGSQPTEIKSISLQEELFAQSVKKGDNIQFGKVSDPLYYSTSTEYKNRTLVKYQNNKPAISQISIGKGKVYFSSIPFTEENNEFISSPLIAPLLYNIALLSTKNHASNTIIGTEATAGIYSFSENRIEITNPEGTVFSPEYRFDRFNKTIAILPNDNMIQNGFYQLMLGDSILPLACNLDKQESLLQTVAPEEIRNYFQDYDNVTVSEPSVRTGQSIADQDINKTEYWHFFVIAMILFLFIETLLIIYL